MDWNLEINLSAKIKNQKKQIPKERVKVTFDVDILYAFGLPRILFQVFLRFLQKHFQKLVKHSETIRSF